MAHSLVSPSLLSSTPTYSLPVELLEIIFCYACIDGGYTGRSLSLVSAHFREVARPVRFQCIALSSLRQIKSFLACLTRERAYTKVRVRHLLLSTWRDGEDIVRIRTGRPPRSDILGSPRLMDGPRWTVWMPIQEALNRELSHLLPFILNTVARDLCALSIVHSWEFGAIQLPESFPLLREFTFCGPPPMFPGGCIRLRPPPSPCFPALRHLHVVCGNISTEFWVHHCPTMTHLRLSDLNCAASTLADELRSCLAIGFGECTIIRSLNIFDLIVTCFQEARSLCLSTRPVHHSHISSCNLVRYPQTIVGRGHRQLNTTRSSDISILYGLIPISASK